MSRTPAPTLKLNDPANWSPGAAPRTGDVVVFDVVVLTGPWLIHPPGGEAGDEVAPDAIVDEREADGGGDS